MKHEISADPRNPLLTGMAEAVATCVHCGFCLPACPTYVALGQEMDSPRGRIVLMKEVLEGRSSLASAMPHVDRCLGCLGCETACPSGVKYRELISPFRQLAIKSARPSFTEKVRRWSLLQTVPHPNRFRLAARCGGMIKPLARFLPSPVRAMLDLLPPTLPAREIYPEVIPAQGERRARVALLIGCAQQVLAPEINRATIDVLTKNGVEVVIPKSQVCCGALAWHVGEADLARRHARTNLQAFPKDVDAIVTNAAGCGSGLHEYPLMLKGHLEEGAAKDFAHQVQDVSAFLFELGMIPPAAAKHPVTIAYHDACHLSHAQGVRQAPRELLRSIPGVTLVEVPDGELCCGSAGSYNIDQPGIASHLGKLKALAIRGTGATWLAAGNIGCLTQIAFHLRQGSEPIHVVHTLEILSLAYAGKLWQI